MRKIKLFSLILLSTLFFAACSGTQGPAGPVGPVGPQGPSGSDGQDGNANVASSTVTVNPNDWYWENTSWRVDFNFDAITPSITDYGAVLVYMENNNTWRQLPMTFYYSEIDNSNNEEMFFSSSLEVSTYDKGVSIFWTESDFYDGFRPEQHRFKIVVIAAAYYSAHSDIDYSDYNNVKAIFNLAD